MSAISDVQHLRQTGIWPNNTPPAWALEAARARGARPDDPQIVLDAIFAEALLERASWLPRVQQLEQQLQTAATERRDLEAAVRSAAIARNPPPIGPLLLLTGNGVIGVGRNTETGLVVLWAEPAGAAATDFRRWVAVNNLLTRDKP